MGVVAATSAVVSVCSASGADPPVAVSSSFSASGVGVVAATSAVVSVCSASGAESGADADVVVDTDASTSSFFSSSRFFSAIFSSSFWISS